MDTFKLYFELGMEHILDVRGYDHILFVVALTTIYQLKDWKRVLILVTAFTIGHSITLALATLHVIRFNADLIEFLIPVTIFFTAIANLIRKRAEQNTKKVQLNYWLALIFGLIHGMGFSNYLRSLLGSDTTIFTQLLAFNVGLEVGQIIIVLSFMALSFLFVGIIGVSKRDWKIVISSGVAAIATTLMLETKFW
ncbi:MAG: HupE/UreJ family protein [Cyclobacteriaceae bacterium]|nr:HupE/UreJ family protein [Cyclobacteriaceae bacterium]